MTWVFKLDGSLQGNLGEVIPLETAIAEIEVTGLRVLWCEQRIWPGPIPRGIGFPTGRGYVFHVDFDRATSLGGQLVKSGVVPWPERAGASEFLHAWRTCMMDREKSPWLIRRGIHLGFGLVNVPQPANDSGTTET